MKNGYFYTNNWTNKFLWDKILKIKIPQKKKKIVKIVRKILKKDRGVEINTGCENLEEEYDQNQGKNEPNEATPARDEGN